MGLVSPIGTVEAEIPIPEKIEEDVESVEGESGKEEAIPKTIKEEVFYFTLFYQVYNFTAVFQYKVPCKAGVNRIPAVNAGKALILFIAAKLQRFFYDRGEIQILAYMHHARVGHHLGGINSGGIVFTQRHKAVCCKYHRCGNVNKFSLLGVPGSAEVAF